MALVSSLQADPCCVMWLVVSLLTHGESFGKAIMLAPAGWRARRRGACFWANKLTKSARGSQRSDITTSNKSLAFQADSPAIECLENFYTALTTPATKNGCGASMAATLKAGFCPFTL